MRIGIDVRYLSHGLVGGVHTYITHFVSALIELATDDQIFLYADTKRPFELQQLPAHVTVRYLPYRNMLSSVNNDLYMKRIIAQDHLEVVHFPANYGFGPASARTVITLHDELNILPWPHLIKNCYPKNARTLVMTTYLHLCTRAALRRASIIVTVSEYARRQISRYSGFELQNIIPVPHAPTPDLRRIEDREVLDDVRQRLGVSKPFVLADALKNPAVLVRAWQRLPPGLQTTHEIVFFSRRPDPLPIVHEAANTGIARLLVRPSRADLIALYSQAQAFVFPSWIEGFGIPILEAMTCGAPVIASDRGSIPEVAGEAALIMEAEDDATLADYLTRILTQHEEAQRLQHLGYARAAQFSWSGTARQILASYQQALSL